MNERLHNIIHNEEFHHKPSTNELRDMPLVGGETTSTDPRTEQLQDEAVTFVDKYPLFNALQSGAHVDREMFKEEIAGVYDGMLKSMIHSRTIYWNEETDTYSIPQVIARKKEDEERRKNFNKKTPDFSEPTEGRSWLDKLRRRL